jgi:hypothetical protein
MIKKLFPDFIESIKKAKMTGKLIAHARSLGLIFPNQTISLIGYNIGAEIAK